VCRGRRRELSPASCTGTREREAGAASLRRARIRRNRRELKPSAAARRSCTLKRLHAQSWPVHGGEQARWLRLRLPLRLLRLHVRQLLRLRLLRLLLLSRLFFRDAIDMMGLTVNVTVTVTVIDCDYCDCDL
jgi:hypothetical protein